MTCPHCHAQVPEEMTFCGHCGTRLAATAPELRQLTVLFCDLVGSTAMAERLDPEELREVTREYHAVCAEVIRRHEGHVAQYLGDGVLVYFGHPMAHEDDAQRAVRTALGIQERLRQLSPRLEEAHGAGVSARIGIHTGPVVIGDVGTGTRSERLALGKTPNLAARVQDVAEPGGIVLTRDTQTIIRGYFDLEPLGARELRGLSESVELYRVVGASGIESRLDVARRRGLTELIGRGPELDVLWAQWERTRDEGVRAALVAGEAGIGKSRLVDALRQRISGGAGRVLECTSSPYHRHSALHPVIALIGRELGIGRETSPEERLAILERRLERRGLLTGETRLLMARLLSIPVPDGADAIAELPPPVQRERTLQILRSWLFNVASSGPVLWVFEDLHWTDPTTLDFLGSVLDADADVPLLAVLTHRPEFVPPWKPNGVVAALTLERLSPASARSMVGHVTGGKPLPEEVVTRVLDRAEGVPLYVEEVTKAVLETGLLEELDDRFVLAGPLPVDLIPATVQGSLTARLDRLGDAKAIAQVAATIGREFRFDVLAAVAEVEEGELRRSIERLIDTELVFRDEAAHDESYLFKHALIQDAAYLSLLKKTRRELHQRIADALSAIPDVATAQPHLLAQHYTAAGRPELAVPLWVDAAHLATARAANQEVIEHCRRGLEAVEELEGDERLGPEIELVMAVIPAIQHTAGFASPELPRFFDRSRELAELIGDPMQRFRVVAQNFAFRFVGGHCAEALLLARELLELGRAVGHPAAIFLGHACLGVVQLFSGLYREALASGREAVRYATPEADPIIIQTAGMSGQSYPWGYIAEELWALGYPDQAREAFDRAIATARRLGHAPTIAHVLGDSTHFLPHFSDPRAVLDRVAESLSVEAERGSTFWEPFVSVYKGWALAALGQHDEGIELMRRSIATYRAGGSGITQVHMLCCLATGLMRAERWDEAHDVLEEAIGVVDRLGERFFEPELHRLKGEILRVRAGRAAGAAGRAAELTAAEACIRDALRIARHQEARSLELRAATSLFRLQSERGDATEGRAALVEVYGWFTEGFDTPDLEEAKALLETAPA